MITLGDRPSEPCRIRLPTAHDVAHLAGVSQSAVSRAYTEGASISSATRDKVLEAAVRLGYRPNLIARSLITQRSQLIGVAIAYMDNHFYPAILEIISSLFRAVGYRVVLFTPDSDGRSDPMLDELLHDRVDAVILASARISSRFAEECARASVPVVVLNRTTNSTGVSSVTGQNELGGETIARHLLDGAHRRFAYVAGLEDSLTSQERERDFTRVLRAAGQEPLRAVGHYSGKAARESACLLLDHTDRPDAIFCANDHMAFAVLETARYEFGLAVGDAISIVGFDDVQPAAWPSFDLTAYAQPAREMAERVVAVTLAHLHQPTYVALHEVVPGRLVLRSSSRRPSGD